MRIFGTKARLAIALAAAVSAAMQLPVAAAQEGGSISITSPSGACGPVQAATPYPSSIQVSGLPEVLDLNLTLSFTHARPDDVAVLLVGPGNQKVLLMADVGGDVAVPGATLTFDDEAGSILPDAGPLVSGSFRPTDGTDGGVGCASPTSLPAPAPSGGYGTSLAVFDGIEPTGAWRLFVLDDTAGANGDIASWSLDLTVAEPYLLVLVGGAGSGTVTAGGISCPPDCAQHSTPGGSFTLKATPASGSVFTGWSGACTGAAPTCSVSLTGPIVTVGAIFQPTGTPSPTTGADLSVTVSAPAEPIPVGPGGTVTFAVANAGPDTVAGVTLIIDLPSSVEVVTAPAACTLSGDDLSCALSGLGGGGGTQIAVKVSPTKNEPFTVSASVSSTTTDLDPADNAGSVTVDVIAPCTILGTNGPEELRGSNGIDVICGRGGADVLMGLDGPDILRGGPGNDELRGSLGDDTVLGGGGADELHGGQGTDVCDATAQDDEEGCEQAA